MTAFPNIFSDSTQPLQPPALDEKAAQAVQQLADKGYEVQAGLTPEFARQILAMAQEPAIREYCPKDAAERFTDQAAAGHWLAKQRAVFLLLQRAGSGKLRLAGYGWAGPASNSHVADGETTFALRVGEVGHGQGLAAPFSWLIIAASTALYGARDFWLETWASNGAAVHIYHKLGFETVSEEPGHRPTATGEKVADTRIYMRLPNWHN